MQLLPRVERAGRSLLLTLSTKKGQTDFKPTRSQGRITASTRLKPSVASCLQGEERCQPDSAPWATTSWGRIGEGLCPDWQAGGSVTGPGGYTARGVRIFSQTLPTETPRQALKNAHRVQTWVKRTVEMQRNKKLFRDLSVLSPLGAVLIHCGKGTSCSCNTGGNSAVRERKGFPGGSVGSNPPALQEPQEMWI